MVGELSELLGRELSPVDLWQYPTINALTLYLTGGEVEPVPLPAGDEGRAASGDREPIAVIGVGCRFPGGVQGPDALWDFMVEGRTGVVEVPQGRWDRFSDGSPENAAALAGTTRWGGFLDDVAAFDAEFFEIPAGEADKMDPQQRLLLEVTHEAFEHAGIAPQSLRHTQTGVFAGACLAEYGYLAASDLSAVDPWSGTGSALSIIANRLSYYLRSARSVGDGGHGVFVVAGGGASGVSEPAVGGVRRGFGRRGQRVVVPGADPQFRCGRSHVPLRCLPLLRCRGRWIRAQ